MMIDLEGSQIAEYFRRCYTSVDGLWFVKVEDACGFERALQVDNEVWKVLPKIQARFFKSAANLDRGISALRECLTTRLHLEGFTFTVPDNSGEKELRVTISQCPWHTLLLKSGRESISSKIGMRICTTEYTTWASEFGEDIKFQLQHKICSGEETCSLHFYIQ